MVSWLLKPSIWDRSCHTRFGYIYTIGRYLYSQKIYSRKYIHACHIHRLDYYTELYGYVYEYGNAGSDYRIGRMVGIGCSYTDEICLVWGEWMLSASPNALFFANVL